MSEAAAIGDELRLGGYALAGVEVVHAAAPAEVEVAWQSLSEDVGLLLLTPEAHAVLCARLPESGLVWAVVPS